MYSTLLDDEVCFVVPRHTSTFAGRMFDSARVQVSQMRVAEPLLFRLGATMLALAGPIALAAATNAHLMDDAVVNPWAKPLKFALSLSMLLWTLALLMRGLRMPSSWRRAVREVAAVGAAAELAFVTWQAARAVHAPGTSNEIDRLLVGGASASILLVCAVCIAVSAMYLDDRRVLVTDRPMLVAIRHGLAVFVIGSAIGGYILTRGSHVVGAAVDGPAMPITSWSAAGGDLRIAHFLALHAVQVVPLVAWALGLAVPSISERVRLTVVRATSAAMAAVISFTLVQALLAHPLY